MMLRYSKSSGCVGRVTSCISFFQRMTFGGGGGKLFLCVYEDASVDKQLLARITEIMNTFTK